MTALLILALLALAVIAYYAWAAWCRLAELIVAENTGEGLDHP